MVRPVKTFNTDDTYKKYSEVKTENKVEEKKTDDAMPKRKPLIQLEPSCFYEDSINLDNHSSIPQSILKKEENNVELNKVEKALQSIGIIPSDSWIAGKSKNLWVNLAHNIIEETFGKSDSDDMINADYIVELPNDLAKVDSIEASYSDKTSSRAQTFVAPKEVSENYALFYSEVDEDSLDPAPSCCEINK